MLHLWHAGQRGRGVQISLVRHSVRSGQEWGGGPLGSFYNQPLRVKGEHRQYKLGNFKSFLPGSGRGFDEKVTLPVKLI